MTMNALYDLAVTLQIKAPVLTAGRGNEPMVIDRVFYRDCNGNIVLPSSHIKGKLKESINDLKSFPTFSDISIDKWFGLDSSDSFEASNAGLRFSDFILNTEMTKPPSISIKVAINLKTGTAKHHALQMNEQLFAPCSTSAWIGHVYFWAADQSEADNIANIINLGFKWITSFGSMKGIGFGQLKKVETNLQICEDSGNISCSIKEKFYNLQIEMQDDLFIGGIVNSSNYRESEKNIPGTVLKGSLAQSLNYLCGNNKNIPIDEKNDKVEQNYPLLAKFFSQITFSHAFPCPPDQSYRATVIPFSTIEYSEGKYKDIALISKNQELDHGVQAPKFQIDWKDDIAIRRHYGWQECITTNKTRTRIDKKSRTAQESQLYTFQYVSPFSKLDPDSDTPRQKVKWIANLILPSSNTEKIAAELFDVMDKAWKFLGKRSSRFTFSINSGKAPNAMPQKKDAFINNNAIITLQSDALLFSAFDQDDLNDLFSLYKKYWDDATQNTCTLVDYFARQKMLGRYYGKQFSQLHDGYYYPYVLTTAGSVFVLQTDEDDLANASNILKSIQENGLPLPLTIREKAENLTIQQNEIWKICPFVRENGYGEILVNLEQHWNPSFIQIKGVENV